MKKLIKVTAAIALALSFSSHAFVDINKAELKLANSLIDGIEDSKIVSKLVDRYGYDLLFATLQHYSKTEDGQSKAELIDTTVFKLLVTKHPSLSAKWSENYDFKGIVVNQDNSLYDPERVKFSTPEFNTFTHKMTEQMDGSTPIFEKEIPLTSYHKMMNGEPATGPDGKDIVLCRLTNLGEAQYFEFSTVDSINVLNIVQSEMEHHESCLVNNLYINEYWLERSDDFKVENRLK